MKKFFLIVIVFFMSFQYSFAEIYEAQYCAVPQKEEKSNTVSAVLSNITGTNFLSSKAAELAIQKVIKKELGSNTNVELYPYSLGSLIQGKFKKMTIESKSLNLTGLYVSKFNAQTVCEYNQVGVKDNNLLFKENFVMGFSGKITNADLEKTMSSPQYLKMVDSAKITTFGQILFKISYMKLSLKNDRLILIANVMSPILWGTDSKKITATSVLKIENGKLIYDDLKIMNKETNKSLKALLSLFNLINPFTFDIKLSENTTGYTSVKNVIIENNTIIMDGVLYIPKNN